MKRILFIISGLGLGNSTRCDAIIQELVSGGNSIDILSSNNGIEYFRTRNYIENIYKFDSLYYGSNKGKLSMLRTFLSVPNFVKIFVENIKYLKKLIKDNDYSAIVIDSDYTLIALKKQTDVPIIAINNANIIIEECDKIHPSGKEIRLQYFVEKADNWFHKKVPDVVLCPTIISKGPDGEAIKYFSPFVRSGLEARPFNRELKNILVMMSGSGFGTSAEEINRWFTGNVFKVDVLGCKGPSQGLITYHGRCYNNLDLVNNADLMVVNGGFSAVSETVVLCKPSVILPIENHSEQLVNASIVERAGLGLMASHESVSSKIGEVIARYSGFVKAHKEFSCEMSGAQKAALAIDDIVTLEVKGAVQGQEN